MFGRLAIFAEQQINQQSEVDPVDGLRPEPGGMLCDVEVHLSTEKRCTKREVWTDAVTRKPRRHDVDISARNAASSTRACRESSLPSSA